MLSAILKNIEVLVWADPTGEYLESFIVEDDTAGGK